MDLVEKDIRNYKHAIKKSLEGFFLFSDAMRIHILSTDRLIEINGSDITINIRAFDEYYIHKHISDLETYGQQLTIWLKPHLNYLTKCIGFGGYWFGLTVKDGPNFYKKTISTEADE